MPLRVMSTTVRQALGDMSSAGTGKFAAALLTSTSGRPNASRGLIEGGTDLIRVTNVARDPEHTGSECLNRLPSCVEVLGLAAGDDQVGPQPRELGGNGLAEPRSAARHEDAAPGVGSGGQGQRSHGRRLRKSSLLGHVQLPV